jgi:YcxB-like protein
MNFNITFKPDLQYYKEAYGEIVSTLKLKKYEPYFAIIMIVLGVFFFFQDTDKRLGIFPVVFSCIGFYELFKLYFEKKKWLKDRMDSQIVGQQIELQFSNEVIKLSGPFSNGEMTWNGLNKIVKTKNGILLKPENGISIYLPNKLFTDTGQLEFIMSKQKKNST